MCILAVAAALEAWAPPAFAAICVWAAWCSGNAPSLVFSMSASKSMIRFPMPMSHSLSSYSKLALVGCCCWGVVALVTVVVAADAPPPGPTDAADGTTLTPPGWCCWCGLDDNCCWSGTETVPTLCIVLREQCLTACCNRNCRNENEYSDRVWGIVRY